MFWPNLGTFKYLLSLTGYIVDHQVFRTTWSIIEDYELGTWWFPYVAMSTFLVTISCADHFLRALPYILKFQQLCSKKNMNVTFKSTSHLTPISSTKNQIPSHNLTSPKSQYFINTRTPIQETLQDSAPSSQLTHPPSYSPNQLQFTRNILIPKSKKT